MASKDFHVIVETEYSRVSNIVGTTAMVASDITLSTKVNQLTLNQLWSVWSLGGSRVL